jgi:hypothetical protein
MGDVRQADIALKGSERAECGYLVKEAEEGIKTGNFSFLKFKPNDFDKHLFVWQSIRPSCERHPSFIPHVDRKIAELENKLTPAPSIAKQPLPDSSGSSRWLPPDSPNKPKTTAPQPTAPLKEIHMGNKGVETGGKERPTHGLSLATRQKLDAIRNDPV